MAECREMKRKQIATLAYTAGIRGGRVLLLNSSGKSWQSQIEPVPYAAMSLIGVSTLPAGR